MDKILSLIGTLAADTVRIVQTVLSASGAVTGEARWLAPGKAWEVPFAHEAPAAMAEAARAALGAAPVDVNVLDAGGRRKKLLVADMDSTVITCECLDEIADLLGLKEKVSAITERAMRGELAFEPALRARVALLEGLSESRLEEVYRTRVTLTAGARTLIATMRAQGAYTLLVSGGFTYFTRRVAAAAGFDEERANRLLAQDGKLTGTVAEPILGREAKLAALIETARRLRLTPADALAVGDGANDLAMIQAAGLGVAFHAKPVVAAAANASVAHGDLTALLYLQGYCEGEFINA